MQKSGQLCVTLESLQIPQLPPRLKWLSEIYPRFLSGMVHSSLFLHCFSSPVFLFFLWQSLHLGVKAGEFWVNEFSSESILKSTMNNLTVGPNRCTQSSYFVNLISREWLSRLVHLMCAYYHLSQLVTSWGRQSITTSVPAVLSEYISVTLLMVCDWRILSFLKHCTENLCQDPMRCQIKIQVKTDSKRLHRDKPSDWSWGMPYGNND